LLSKEVALQGLILHFNLSVDSSDVIQGLLDGTTLSPSPDGPPLKIGPFLKRLSSKPKDLHIAILSLFLKDSHGKSSGSLGRVLGEYLHGQYDGWKVVDHRIFSTLEAQAISTTRSLSRHLSRILLQTGLSGFFCYQIHSLVIPSTAFSSSRLPQIAFVMKVRS
jgi:hypothetical protein